MKCAAIAKSSNKQCSKNIIKGSKYCLLHQEKTPIIIGIIVGFITGLVASFLIAWFFDKKADINVSCFSTENNYCSMECIAENRGRKQAINTKISFSYLLPKDTEVITEDSIYDISLNILKYIPDPNFFPDADKIFNVLIPNIPPKKEVKFIIHTTDKNNIKACEYLAQLMEKQKEIIKSFGEKLVLNYPELYEVWNSDNIINARVKKANLYRPSEVIFEEDIRKVNFLTDEENNVYDRSIELTNKYKGLINFIETYNLPVISIETSDGDRLLQIFPLYFKFIMALNKTKILDFSLLGTNEFKIISEDTIRYELPFIQPESYD